jgi:hypothetical protein
LIGFTSIFPLVIIIPLSLSLSPSPERKKERKKEKQVGSTGERHMQIKVGELWIIVGNTTDLQSLHLLSPFL